MSVLSPLNQTYNTSRVSLVFTVNKPFSWTGYSLNGGENVTVMGNVTFADLSVGLHNVAVYANDTFGNMGVSETLNFAIAVPELEPESFPPVPVVAVSVVVVLAVAGLLVYHKKHKRYNPITA